MRVACELVLSAQPGTGLSTVVVEAGYPFGGALGRDVYNCEKDRLFWYKCLVPRHLHDQKKSGPQ